MIYGRDSDKDIADLLTSAFHDGPEDAADTAFMDEARRRRRLALEGGPDRWVYSHSARFGELERQLFQAIIAVRNDDHTTFDLDVSCRLLEQIGARAETEGVASAIAAAEVETAKVLRHMGHLEAAVDHGRHALDISEREGFRRTRILAHFEVGMVLCGKDDAAADRHYAAAGALLDAADVDLSARIMYGRARSARKRADLREAIHLVETSIGLYEAAGDGFGLARAQARLGSYLRLRGEFGIATQHLKSALGAAQRCGFRRVEAVALLDLGHIYRMAHRDAAAHAVLTSARVLFSEIGHDAGRGHALIGLALLEQRAGNHQEAVSSAEEALALYRERDARGCRATSAPTAFALRTLGECWRDTGREPDRAGGYLDLAIEAYRQLDNRDGEALSLAAKAKLLARSPDTIRYALTLAMEAVNGLAEMPGRFWQGVDQTIVNGNHSWCFESAVAIASRCESEAEQWKIIGTAETDRRLRGLRLSLAGSDSPLGQAVRELSFVELMMRPPAHDPDVGFVPAERGSLVATREALLDRVHELAPSVANEFRAPPGLVLMDPSRRKGD